MASKKRHFDDSGTQLSPSKKSKTAGDLHGLQVSFDNFGLKYSGSKPTLLTLKAKHVQVHIVVNAIANGSRRVKSWQNGLEKHGAAVVQVDMSVSNHIASTSLFQKDEP